MLVAVAVDVLNMDLLELLELEALEVVVRELQLVVQVQQPTQLQTLAVVVAEAVKHQEMSELVAMVPAVLLF